jgi:hypothetical protein
MPRYPGGSSQQLTLQKPTNAVMLKLYVKFMLLAKHGTWYIVVALWP